MSDRYVLTGLEAVSRKLLDAVNDHFNDDDHPIDRVEWQIMKIMDMQYAWEMEKDDVINIVGATWKQDIESVPAKRRFNAAFRRLVRFGFLYSKAGTKRNGYHNRVGCRFYGVQLDREKAARKAAA